MWYSTMLFITKMLTDYSTVCIFYQKHRLMSAEPPDALHDGLWWTLAPGIYGYCGNDSVWPPSPGHEKHCSICLALLDHSGESHAVRTLKQPSREARMMRSWGLLPTRSINVPAVWVSYLGSGLSSPRHLQDLPFCLPSWPQTQERLCAISSQQRCSLIPDSQKLHEIIHSYGFKTRHFGEIVCAATDNC